MAQQGKELKKTDASEQSLTAGFFSPKIDVAERGGKMVVSAELPGLERKDVKVDAQDGALTISAERRSERKEDRDGWFYSESSYGSFQRSIALPADVDASTCDVQFRDGRLEITLEKRAEKH